MTRFKRITVKYASACSECGVAIAAGATAEWKKGAGLRCVGHFSPGSGGFDSVQDEADYFRGYHEMAEIQAISAAGSEYREQLYREAELAAYNRGEE